MPQLCRRWSRRAFGVFGVGQRPRRRLARSVWPRRVVVVAAGVVVLGSVAGSGSALAGSGFPSGVTVSVGYADTERPHGFFPTPWAGGPGVIFEGCSGSCTFDGGAVMLTNTTGSAVTVDSLQVVLSTCTFAIWPSGLSLPADESLIYTQTVSGASSGCQTNGSLDTSDVGPGGVSWSGDCSQSGVVPQVVVSVNGAQETFTDAGQVLNTGGIDLASCPVGSNESEPWTQLNGGVGSDQQYGGSNPSVSQLAGCNTGDPVDCATGDFWESFAFLSVPGRGVPLGLGLTYNSLTAAQGSPVGFGWSFSYGMHLVVDPSERRCDGGAGERQHRPLHRRRGHVRAAELRRGVADAKRRRLLYVHAPPRRLVVHVLLERGAVVDRGP